MKRRIVIAAGGTGGHLFPAQAFARELQKSNRAEILFVGCGLGSNSYFRKEYPSREVAGASLKKRTFFSALFKIAKGTLQSFKILKEQRPDLVVGFGSFHSFPVLLAAVCMRIPLVLFEANAHPGKVNRLFSRWARCSHVHFLSAAKHLKGDVVEVAMPLWTHKIQHPLSQAEARAYFGLEPQIDTVLVFGGSQGASSINNLFCEAVQGIERTFQVIHLAGAKADLEELRAFYARLKLPACVKSFEDNMTFAWKSASFAICRAGAATLAEAIAFEVPTLLIPYPHAADDHQRKNALFVEREIKGAAVLGETHLGAAIVKMLHKEELNKMRCNLGAFRESRAVEGFAARILKMLN